MPEPHNWEADPRDIPEILPIWEASHGWSGAEGARQVGAGYPTYRQCRTGRRKVSHETMLRRLMTLIDKTTPDPAAVAEVERLVADAVRVERG
jgi:hypothetical protein